MNVDESRRVAQAAFLEHQLTEAIRALRRLKGEMTAISVTGRVDTRGVARCLRRLREQGLEGWLLNVLDATAESMQRDSEGFEAIGIPRERLEDLHDRSTS